MESNTGINTLSHYKFPIIFDNLQCPYCGKQLTLDSKRLGGKLIKVRYVCSNCKLVVPIMHDMQSKEIYPLYDNSIQNFLSDFGKDIRDKKYDLLKNT